MRTITLTLTDEDAELLDRVVDSFPWHPKEKVTLGALRAGLNLALEDKGDEYLGLERPSEDGT